MPLQVEIDKQSSSFIESRIILPGFFGFMHDFSSGQPEIVGFYCREGDVGQAILRFSDGVEYDGQVVSFSGSPGVLNEGIVIAELEEDTAYRDELIDSAGLRYKVASYHLGGLAAYYAGSLS